MTTKVYCFDFIVLFCSVFGFFLFSVAHSYSGTACEREYSEEHFEGAADGRSHRREQ
jgi:hypothetical protein